MPKVLIVTHQPTGAAQYVATVLRNLGIDYDLAYGDSTSSGAPLHTPVGTLNANSNDCRNFLRNYDAVLIVRHGQPLELNASIRIAGYWLSWNDPEDPPLLYFGWNFSVAVTQLDALLPSDFPLIRPDNANLADTVALADNGNPAFSPSNGRLGSVVALAREAVAVYVPAVCAHHSDNRCFYWRYNPAQHSALANAVYTHRIALNHRAGEILGTPAPQPDENYPSNTAIAYRYKNCVFLPQIRAGASLYTTVNTPSFPDIFWVYYALKLAQIAPQRRLVLYSETDHPLEWMLNRVDGMTVVENFLQLAAAADYMRDFYRRTGMVTHHGLVTGSMARPRELPNMARHWQYIHATQFGQPIEVENAARVCHDILLAGHREGSTPCGFHDHTIGTLWSSENDANFRRHSQTHYTSPYSPPGLSFPLEAPNDVRYRKGQCCVRKAHSPIQAGQGDAVEMEMAGETYIEWNYPSESMTGSATNFTLPHGSLQAARLVIESNIAELRAMGFPDGHGGEHRYTNTAGNNAGGPCYWQAAREYGYKALRSSYHCNAAPVEKNVVPPRWVWNGFHLLNHTNNDCSDGGQGGHGLYYPSAPSSYHAVGYLNLDSGGDITGNYPNAVWRAHRRAMTTLLWKWLATNTAMLGAMYFHPGAMLGWNNSQPLARFDGVLEYRPNLPHWNPIVEMYEEMAVIVRVLADYLKFGSVSDLIAVRERVMG